LDVTTPTARVVIKKGSVYRTGASSHKTPYFVHNITLVRTAEKEYLIVETVPSTKTSIFMLPMLFESQDGLRINSEFVAAFVDYEGSTQPLGINLLYRFSGHLAYMEFEQSLIRSPYFIGAKEVDRYHTLYCFKVPDSFIVDYKRIINSEYSKISDTLKKRILAFHSFSETGETYGILYCTEELRKRREEQYDLPQGSLKGVELYELFDLEKETYWNKYRLITDVLKEQPE